MSKHNHHLGITFLAVFVLFVAVSCSKRKEQPTNANAETNVGAPKKGGIFTVATHKIASNVDPAIATGATVNAWTLAHLFSHVVRTSANGESVEPDLAESWEVSQDGRVFTFHLRPKLEFSDGSALRSTDVAFSLRRAAKHPKNPQQSLFPPLEMTTPDDRTVVLTLKEPYAPMLAMLTLSSAAIVPEAYVQRAGESAINETPIGSGPYTLAEWKPNDRMVLRRNPRFWETSRPYLDEIRILAIPDEMTRLLKIQAGEVDMATGVPFNQVETLRRAPNIVVSIAQTLEMTMLGLNRRIPAFADVKVRQSIFWAIDREAIIRTVLFGHADAPTSFLPRMRHISTEPLGHDMAKAKQLLAESGFPGGLSATLVVMSQSMHQQVAVLVKSQLEPLGIKVAIQQLEGPQFFDRLRKGDADMTLLGGRADTLDPADMTQYAITSQGFIANIIGLKNPEFDALAFKAQTEIDPTARTTLYRQLEKAVLDDVVYVPLFLPKTCDAVRANVHGLEVLPTTTTYRFWDVWKSP